jgi:hydrogenase maturation protein HypF
VLARIKVNGIVQGVGFRPFVYRVASQLNLKGYVLNLGDAGVEIEVEGNKEEIEKFIEFLKDKRPPLAKIDEIKVEWRKDKKYKKFEIKKSKEEKKNGTSIIPPDISICQECIEDMEKQERRRNYFFTTCTNCGPRFTIIKKLPYDRNNTTMDEFEMCEECYKEYTDPLNRRYHAQTIACKDCGPQIFLKYEGKIIEGEEAIWKAANLLNNGKIVAIKGIGGYHLACLADGECKAVKRLRGILGRPQKPFALMAKDIEMVEEIAFINDKEKNMLLSYIKPIVLLEKRKELPYVAPGLHNYGIMLPYTGLHFLLFKKIDFPLVMTSANLPGRPIIYSEEEIENIGVDAILFYNRRIWQRCDDSIVKFIGEQPVLIRRSRGFVPSAIKINFKTANIMATGAEENVVACLLKDGYAFMSQYIGHVVHLETFEFFKEAVNHLVGLINFEADAIACDLHPNFLTTKYAEEMAKEKNLPLFKVQHHHAHIAKVIAEYGLKEAIGIAIDGFGYGDDGMAWGGEILYSDLVDYKRLCHLQYHAMPGGDAATKYPLRMLAGILGKEAEEFLIERSGAFPYGEKEVEIVLKQARNAKIKTSSCGRLLDAIAALLDICHKMHYEGEPAMKLESVARKGENTMHIESVIKNNVIETKEMVQQIFENKEKENKVNLAYSAEEYIANSLAMAAIEKAEEMGIKSIVIAGGCAYNEHITLRIKEKVEMEGMKFFIGKLLPCGDGGISFGQAIVANEKMKRHY